jgi:hypothetical protein
MAKFGVVNRTSLSNDTVTEKKAADAAEAVKKSRAAELAGEEEETERRRKAADAAEAVKKRKAAELAEKQSQRDRLVAVASSEAAIVDVDNMAEDDVIELLLNVDHNYFAMMGLSQPSKDLQGRPSWSVSTGSLMKRYRNLARRVHPDKSSHCEAQQAFDALQVAFACLKNVKLRDAYVMQEVNAV